MNLLNPPRPTEFVNPTRLFHNYLASVSSLRDHQRRVKNKYLPEGGDEYKERAAKTFGPLCVTVQDLRNFEQHRRLPLTRGHLSFGHDKPIESSVFLVKTDLLDWDGWRSEAKKYLHSLEGELQVADVVEEYTAAATSFQDWFVRAVAEANRSLLFESNERIKELNAFQQKLTGEGD